MIVMKFGGSSVESVEAIRRVASIVQSQESRRPVVVVSAMGKTTNELLSLARTAVGRDPEYQDRLAALRRYHWENAIQLIPSEKLEELAAILETHFGELGQLLHGLSILGELTPRSIDTISSYGERVSSKILALALAGCGLDAVHMDARDLILTDDRHTQAQPDLKETYKRLESGLVPALENHVVVLGGFIGATDSGVTTTLGRGGSDYTAAIVGAGIDAEEIQIWTDVDGIMTTDPRLIPDARQLKSVSFAEAAELAFFGAKVLHPATVRPAIEKNIPVVILNSRRPDVPGTRIEAASGRSRDIVKALAAKRHITLLNIHSARMFMTYGFLRRVFDVFEKWETSVDVVTTSEVNVSMTVEDAASIYGICRDLEQFADVSVENGLAMISAVGEGLGENAGVAARIFNALANINVRMISQGASLLNLTVVIAESDLERAIKVLHEACFSDADAEVCA